MPTQIAEVGEGVTLVVHNAKALPGDRQFIENAFSKIGRVKEITESQMDLAADLTSCSPAFYAAIGRIFCEIACKHGSLAPEEVSEMVLATMYGTAKLLLGKGIPFNELIDRVATKGGITEEGIKVLDRTLPAVFDEVLRTTLAKREMARAQMRGHYGIK